MWQDETRLFFVMEIMSLVQTTGRKSDKYPLPSREVLPLVSRVVHSKKSILARSDAIGQDEAILFSEIIPLVLTVMTCKFATCLIVQHLYLAGTTR